MTFLSVPLTEPVTLDGYRLSDKWHAVDLLTQDGKHLGRYYSETSHEDAAKYGADHWRAISGQADLLAAVLGECRPSAEVVARECGL